MYIIAHMTYSYRYCSCRTLLTTIRPHSVGRQHAGDLSPGDVDRCVGFGSYSPASYCPTLWPLWGQMPASDWLASWTSGQCSAFLSRGRQCRSLLNEVLWWPEMYNMALQLQYKRNIYPIHFLSTYFTYFYLNIFTVHMRLQNNTQNIKNILYYKLFLMCSTKVSHG